MNHHGLYLIAVKSELYIWAGSTPFQTANAAMPDPGVVEKTYESDSILVMEEHTETADAKEALDPFARCSITKFRPPTGAEVGLRAVAADA